MPSTAPTPNGRAPGHARACGDTRTGYPRDALLPDLFARQARQSPDSEALVWSGGRWTFRELRDRVHHAAAQLQARGVSDGDIVAVLLDRSPQSVVAALAVLEAGAVHLPLDPCTPGRRLAVMIRDAAAKCLVTLPGAAVPLPLPLGRVTTRELAGARTPRREPRRPAGRVATDAAYLVYTSGSTGAPKGVLCHHRGLVRFVTADHPAVPGPGDRLLATTNPTFDVSYYEIFCTLLNGACLVLPEPDVLLDPEALAQSLRRHRITTLWLAAGVFHVHARSAPGMFSGLRCLMVGGDSVSPAAVRAVLSHGAPATLVNGYGPTENGVITTSYTVRDLPDRAELVPIGSPVPATTVHVVRRDGSLAEAGEAGELWAGGDGVAIGYLNDPERTEERFVPDRFGADPQGRLYRTGDIVRLRDDGVLEFLGRRDRQVKLRGFRIELDEVEAVLSAHPDVREAAVDVLGEGPGQHLGAAVVSVLGVDSNTLAARLYDHVRDRLPAHMVPSRLVCVPDLPLTTSGKADHARLLARITRPAAGRREGGAPEDADERAVERIWSEALGTETLRREDDFFALGGTSLMATHVATATRRHFGIDPGNGSTLVRELLSNPTLGAFTARARRLARQGTARASHAKPDFHAEARLHRAIPVAGPLPGHGRPGRVFVSGGTGFLGVHLVDRLLRAGAERLHCLLRTRDESHGVARMAARMRRYDLDPQHLDGRVTVVPGDLSAERFGLDSTTWERLARDSDLIVHCGAQVNFAYPYEALAPANVGGTRTIIELATAHRLKPVHHISTVGVLASLGLTGVRHATEHTPLARPDLLPGGYMQTKWVAEKLVAEAARQGLPASIHRPGEVTGTGDRGVWNTDTLMCALFRTIAQAGVAPDVPLPLDFVPVDHTSDVITRVITHEKPDGRVYHITNPDEARLPLLVDRLRAMSYRVRTVGYQEWVAGIVRAADADPRHPMTPYLPLFVEPATGPDLSVEQTYFTSVFPRLSRSNADRVAADAGLTCPPVDARLIDLYLGRLQESGYLPPPEATGGHRWPLA
ncbi:amino acid adenylation domain-containing protein [Streptomyces sp. TRM 70351]|uniref:amino acid adenylation domain-containing protein n=1 Tax=Streptomyces sp. TRM 70351 TaxID=3116552 RepID=UPI002E7ABB95|nr:amino acid adenylation domain-containing protein [Streptomyces sp. TRM 70351]MEE1928880.1 amino acid adenylation domain-containing protein [Streptomyces sp. TRM 70351]